MGRRRRLDVAAAPRWLRLCRNGYSGKRTESASNSSAAASSLTTAHTLRGVLAVGPVPPPYHGASVVQDAVLRWLRGCGVIVTLANTSGGGRTGVKFHATRIAQHVKALAKVSQIRDRSFAVYITGAGGLGLWYQLPVVALARAIHARTVYHHHSYAYLNHRSLAMALIVLVGRDNVTHIALSSDMAISLCFHYRRISKMDVCSNAAIVPKAAVRRQRPTVHALRIGHLSNLSAEKGLDAVIGCLYAAVASGFDVHLDIAGPIGDPDTEAAMCNALEGPQRERITYHGPLTRSQVPTFLKSLDIFVFPSRYRNEAEPLVVIEALTSGVPVIAYAVGCLPGALKASPWPAVDEGLMDSRVLEALAEVDARGTPELKEAYLSDIARLQLDGFQPRSLAVILAGLKE